jgi:hypothetical protein
MAHENLLATPTPPPTYLPEDVDAAAARQSGADPAAVAATFPAFCAAWADLAEQAMTTEPPDPVAAYAYARTGYHRGLDQLRRAGWRGNGPIPWEHQPNQGFLRSLHMLGVAASAIGEAAEVDRVRQFLRESSSTAAEVLPPIG